jgi:hypothetical protein
MLELLGNVRSGLCLENIQALPDLVVRPGDPPPIQVVGPKGGLCSFLFQRHEGRHWWLLYSAVRRSIPQIRAWNARLVAEGAIGIHGPYILGFPFLI